MASVRTEAGRADGGRWMRHVAIAVLAATMAAGSMAGSAAAQEPPPGLVRVVHGLRGLVADLYLDGTLVLPTFQPERSTDPLTIPPVTTSSRSARPVRR